MIDNQNIAANAAGYYATSAGLLCRNRLFAVISVSDSDIAMSLVNANETDFSCAQTSVQPSLGIGSLTRAIAEKIVSSVNLNAHVIPADNASQLQAEIRRHYALSAKVISFIEKNPDKESLKLSTNFECAPDQKYPVAISIPEVKAMAQTYVRQYVPLFTDFLARSNTKTIDLEKIILVGDVLQEADIRQEFSQLGEDSLVFYSQQDIDNIMAWVAPTPDDETTQFQAVEPEKPKPPINIPEPPKPPVVPPTPPEPPKPQPLTSYKEVPQVSIARLPQGTMVRLDTFDSTPGKGAAFQELECIGEGLLRVVQCNRTLRPGDIVRPFDPVWKAGVQVDEEITRGAQSLGRFRTRLVMHVSVKNCMEDAIS